MIKAQFISILFLLQAMSLEAQEEELILLRELFFQAGKDPCRAKEIVKIIGEGTHKNPVILGYKGTAYTMLADCKKSPFAKYSSFQTGRDLIENALKSQPDNLEIRFLRFNVQDHAPAFLGYNNIEEDKKILLDLIEKEHMHITDREFLKRMLLTLIESERFTTTEKKKLSSLVDILSNN